MKIYTYWRSQATFRVRIALNLKGLKREEVFINLDRGEQFKPEYKATNPQARAWVRGFALINVADSHPLIVPRIRNYLTDVLKVDEAAKTAWIQHWLGAGLEAMEQLLVEKNPAGKFCHGDSPTVADICLVTQVTPAQLFKCPLEPYKRVMRIYEACMSIPAFAEAHPRKQPDYEGH